MSNIDPSAARERVMAAIDNVRKAPNASAYLDAMAHWREQVENVALLLVPPEGAMTEERARTQAEVVMLNLQTSEHWGTDIAIVAAAILSAQAGAFALRETEVQELRGKIKRLKALVTDLIGPDATLHEEDRS